MASGWSPAGSKGASTRKGRSSSGRSGERGLASASLITLRKGSHALQGPAPASATAPTLGRREPASTGQEKRREIKADALTVAGKIDRACALCNEYCETVMGV
jgi:hypothetical protein